MNASDLANLPRFQLLDVRLADDFAAGHIEGARNNCIYEVAFTGRLAETAPDTDQPTIVYGPDASCASAKAAVEKLVLAGYSDVRELAGGLRQAEAEGLEIVRDNPLPPPPSIADGRHPVDLTESRVLWTGRNLVNRHDGAVALKGGWLDFEGNRLTGGRVTLDLTQISCHDLAGTDLHDVLIHHLHDADFFDVANHPEAVLEIAAAAPIEGGTPGAPNLHVTALLHLRGLAHPVEFDAVSGITLDGRAAAQASFAIDRTRWNVRYGSGKLFHRLAGHLVNDLIEIQVRVLTVPG